MGQTFSNTGDVINKFTETFCNLKDAFDSGINVQTTLVSYRITERVDKLSEYNLRNAYTHHLVQ